MRTAVRQLRQHPTFAFVTVFVAGAVALACALLVSSALLVRTVHKMTRTPRGVGADAVLTTTVQLSQGEPR